MWPNVYSQLKTNDNAIFVAGDRILIGNVSKINNGESILINDVKDVKCSNDQFLQLHEIYPELISRVKANFQPFIHSQQINIDKLITDANSNKYVSYYIIKSKDKYDEMSSSFKVNDRIVLLNNEQQFDNVMLHSADGLVDFPISAEVNISVVGLTIDEVLKKNKSVKRESATSNNVNRIKQIESDMSKTGVYKFRSFFAYHDSLYNKRVYGDLPVSNTQKIRLLSSEKVYKISIGPRDIKPDPYKYFMDSRVIVVHGETKAKGQSSQTQGDTFASKINIGDYFYLCRGNDNLELIGKITGEAVECDYLDFGTDGWLQRSYDIVATATKKTSYRGDDKWWTPNNNSTCITIPKHEINDANSKLFLPFFDVKFEYQSTNTKIDERFANMTQPLNQILFGPPGTGKTFSTVNKALEIFGIDLNDKSRVEIKKIFDEKATEGRIKFITFHQSMSYEDFIEGIKPVEPEKDGDPVIYKIHYGVFRRLCIEASFDIAQSREGKVTEEYLDFSIQYDKLVGDIEDKLLDGQKIELKTKTGGTVLVESISQHGNIIIKHPDGTRTYTVSKDRLTRLNYAIKNLDEVSNINDQFRKIIGGSNSSAYWSVLNAIRTMKRTPDITTGKREYTFDEKREVVLAQDKSEYQNKIGHPYVLIIDEINRGNVSQIFGELITLIEEDKRLGREEALEVTLPYSKEKFGVPPNLFIVGTMNTADRSVEALDTALRRRFSFIEMPPRAELIQDIGKMKENHELDMIQILNAINIRIEKLLDKDHQIGHSYFMPVKSIDELKLAFENNIVPLLQEYFFGDYGKIGLILGQEFFKPIEVVNNNIFAEFYDYDSSDFAERTIYKLKDIAKMTNDEFKNAINTLTNKV
jgi:hypothetical protein